MSTKKYQAAVMPQATALVTTRLTKLACQMLNSTLPAGMYLLFIGIIISFHFGIYTATSGIYTPASGIYTPAS
ncbi:MAG: hypothetical protein AAB038_03885, partial [Planctomycetota bacterium]